MFTVGSKVIVIASTSGAKQTTAPRIGSTGYISHSWNSQIYDEEHSFIYEVVDLIFTRYGYEENKRHEKRTVLNAIPFSPFVKNIPGFIGAQCKTVNNINLKNKGYWKNLLNIKYREIKITDIVTLVPIKNNELNLITCPFNDFYDWFDSYLQSNTFKYVLLNLLNSSSNKDRFPVNEDILHCIRRCILNKMYKNDFLDVLKQPKSVDIKQDIVKAITSIMGVYARSTITVQQTDIDIANQKGLFNGHNLQPSTIRRYVLSNLFKLSQKPSFIELKSYNKPALNKVVTTAEKTIDGLRAFTGPILKGKN